MMGSSKSDRSKSWVSKTDLVRWLRCTNTFIRFDRGEIRFDDTVDEFHARLLDDGSKFHDVVESSALPVNVTAQDLPDLFRQEMRLFGLPVLENGAERIYGVPDAVDTAAGGLIPVEVKSHKSVERIDELELAFYWLLLKPYRTRRLRPHGYLILRRDGGPEEVKVDLSQRRLEQVLRLIREIRAARRNGVPPRVCGCPFCRGPLREEILHLTRTAKNLSLIAGIGRRYASYLESLGVGDYEALIISDPSDVVHEMRKEGLFVSVAQVEGWRRHAESYVSGQPVVFGSCLVPDSYIALDLEYLPDSGHIWLIGAYVVDSHGRHYESWWADSSAQERENLEDLAQLVDDYSLLPIVTWSGQAADLPFLRAASQRLGVGGLLDDVQARHIDLFQESYKSLRLPIPEFGLSAVADYFGVGRVSPVHDGMVAQYKYLEYRRTSSQKRRASLKSELLAYNRDDLDALLGVIGALWQLTSQSSGP